MESKKKPTVDLEVSFLKGSGPGGQNRNKRMTGVRARDLVTGIFAMATERRSQAQNRVLAIERLYQKLEDFYHVPLPRVPTKKTPSSMRRRLSEKRHHARNKQERRKKIGYDD